VIAAWAGLTITDEQHDRLDRYAGWLRTEAVRAGGIGPGEPSRIWDRHIAESLAFCEVARSGGPVIDLGTGVGLPAVPLAITHPDCHFVAVDRSERRIDLLRRATSMLGVDNLESRLADVDRVEETFLGLTSRAVSGPADTVRRAERLLRLGGVAIMGLSRRAPVSIDIESNVLTLDVVALPSDLLAGTLTLLRMVKHVDG
jgi:16S rRNA (guanine527-N7)-methyltransferase